jgi:hypothetical protein
MPRPISGGIAQLHRALEAASGQREQPRFSPVIRGAPHISSKPRVAYIPRCCAVQARPPGRLAPRRRESSPAGSGRATFLVEASSRVEHKAISEIGGAIGQHLFCNTIVYPI